MKFGVGRNEHGDLEESPEDSTFLWLLCELSRSLALSESGIHLSLWTKTIFYMTIKTQFWGVILEFRLPHMGLIKSQNLLPRVLGVFTFLVEYNVILAVHVGRPGTVSVTVHQQDGTLSSRTPGPRPLWMPNRGVGCSPPGIS